MAIQLKKLTISIFSSLLLFQLAASDIGLISSCITLYNQTVNNQTQLIDTSYETTLQTLFSNLASSSLTYFNSSAGQSPAEKAYGLYLCRGDATSDACHTCVKSMTDNLPTHFLTSPCKEGFAYMDNCMIHFANYSFFGTSNNQALVQVVGKFSSTNFQEYNQTLEAVLKQVINDASNSTTSFATREGSGADQVKVFALAQCTQDLDRGNCSECLNAALVRIANITYSQPAGIAESGAALLPSCELWYDNVRFYGVSSAASNSPLAVSALLVATWSLFLIHFLLG